MSDISGTVEEVETQDVSGSLEAQTQQEISGTANEIISHKTLTDRDASEQHPIAAITGLQAALTVLTNGLNTEAATRENADGVLETAINGKQDKDITISGTTATVTAHIQTIKNDLGDLGDQVSDKEDKSNKVTSISASSTDTQYPSAKCVYTIVGNIESAINTIRGVS